MIFSLILFGINSSDGMLPEYPFFISFLILFFDLAFSQEFITSGGGRGSFCSPMEWIVLRDSIPVWTLFRLHSYSVTNFSPNAITIGRINKDSFKKYAYLNNTKNERGIGIEIVVNMFKNASTESKYNKKDIKISSSNKLFYGCCNSSLSLYR